MASECCICGKKNSKTVIKDSRFTVNEDRSCIVCVRCFDLWISENDSEIYKLLRKKLVGESNEE